VNKAVYVENDVFIVNPKLLLEQIRKEFARLMSTVKSKEGTTERFADSIRYDFREDLTKLEIVEKRIQNELLG